MSDALSQAYDVLNQARVNFEGRAVGTIASNDPNASADNYAECFVRDFAPASFVFLLDGDFEIVRNFIELVLTLRDQQVEEEGHQMLPRVMPASFRVSGRDGGGQQVHADFGDRAIGRVAPVDSMMWWLVILSAYRRVSGDDALVRRPEVQHGIRMIMDICLRDHFEVFPTLLVPDASFMIDRRMGVYGHPLEIQALFCAALSIGHKLLAADDPGCRAVREQVASRLQILVKYVRRFYWMDPERLNKIRRYPTEVFGQDSKNQLNINPASIPEWAVEWLPDEAGYLVGNLGPERMDFRFFSLGNLISMMFGLADNNQVKGIMRLFETRWENLIGTMPVKICYPAMEGQEWRLLTGSDQKNTPWSYHNGGNWPALLWPFVAAALGAGHEDLAQRSYELAVNRLPGDRWPEYYDGRTGRFIGRRANDFQTWSAASLILARKFLDDPDAVQRLGLRGID